MDLIEFDDGILLNRNFAMDSLSPTGATEPEYPGIYLVLNSALTLTTILLVCREFPHIPDWQSKRPSRCVRVCVGLALAVLLAAVVVQVVSCQ